MANKVYNLAGGLHSAAAYAGWENELFGGNAVASPTALQVSAGSGMTVSVGKGNALIDTGDDYSRRVALTEAVDVTLDQADTSLPRNDLIVIYVDMAVAPVQTVQDNTNGILKVVAVKGTPASSPSDPDAGTIQQTIGAGNPYMTLASIRVNAGASAISSGNITDKRPASPNVYWTTSEIQDIAEQAVGHLGDIKYSTTKIWYGVTAQLFRIGNIVVLSFDANATANINAWQGISSQPGEALPTGFRPAQHCYGMSWVNESVSNLDIYPDGHMEMYTRDSGTYLKGFAVYGTSDAWPN